MIDQARDFAGAFGLNYPEFPDSCRGFEFSLIVNVDEMFVGGLDRNLEQFGDKPLREPNGLAIEPHMQV